MSASPQYASAPLANGVRISTANTALDGTGTMGILVTAPPTGARVDNISIVANGATAAGMIRIFIHDGTNFRLYREVPVAALVPSGTQQAFAAYLSGLGLTLPSGWSVRVATHNANSFDVLATSCGAF